VSLAGGTLRIASNEQGTLVQAHLPASAVMPASCVAHAQT